MDVFETICKRRSIRKYDGSAVSEADLKTIMTAGLLAPTGKNSGDVELIAVTGADAMQELAKVKPAGAAMLKSADCAIVVLGDANRSDTWIEDGSAAISFMMLQATELGIGNCWCQCRCRSSAEQGENGVLSAGEYVTQLLGVPENYQVLAILALGMPESWPQPHSPAEVNPAKLHMGRF